MSSQQIAPARPGAHGRRRKLVTAALALLALWAVWNFWLRPGRIFEVEKFNAKAWREKATLIARGCSRGGMAADIRDSLLKQTMTRADVEAMLGEPSRRTASEYEYALGFCSGFQVDIDSLHVYFDETGKYKSSAIIQH